MTRENCRLEVLLVGVFLLLGILVTNRAVAQITPPEIEWERTFGGQDYNYAFSVQETTDGGYIVAGGTGASSARTKVYLVKTDTEGNLVWEKTFFERSGFAFSVQETTDGGYIVAGETSSIGAGSRDVYLVKTDTEGNLVWEKTFGGTFADCAFSVQETRDGGYILAGRTNSFGAGRNDVYLVKTDREGNLLWEKTFGGEGQDAAYSVQETAAGGYILAGLTDAESRDVYLLKTDSDGNRVWEKTFGGEGYDQAYSVQETTDGGYIVAGSWIPRDSRVGTRMTLMKTDSEGNGVWEKALGCGARSVQETTDGGYIVAGSGPQDCFSSFYLAKADSRGNLVWESTFGLRQHAARCVQQTTDGGYIVAGGERTPVYLVKFAPEESTRNLFLRGDVTADGDLNITDAVSTLNHLFRGGPGPDCADAADADDNGDIQITDAVYTLNFLFRGGTAIPEPAGPECGVDPTADELGCEMLLKNCQP